VFEAISLAVDAGGSIAVECDGSVSEPFDLVLGVEATENDDVAAVVSAETKTGESEK
jgi:hypothetical protein